MFGAYTATARRAVTRLDRQLNQLSALDTARRTAAAQATLRISDLGDLDLLTEMNRTLSSAHARRLTALLKQCHGTFAIDRGVRQLRNAVCDAIAADLAAVRTEPLDPSLGTGQAYAERALQRERKQWHVSSPEAPDVAPFEVNTAAFERLNHYTDQPIGARLVVRQHNVLQLIDIDRSTTVDIQPNVDEAVALEDWVAVFDGESTWAFDPKEPDRRALLARGQVALVASPDTNTVWLINQADEAERRALEYDRTGTVVGQFDVPVHGRLAAATNAYLVVEILDTSETGAADINSVRLFDRRTQRLVRQLGPASVFAARGDVVVTSDGETVHATTGDYDLHDAFEGLASLSPTGQTIAVGRAYPSGDVVLASRDGSRKTVNVDQAEEVAWTADGRWLFVSGGSRLFVVNPVTLETHALRLPRGSYDIVGAF